MKILIDQNISHRIVPKIQIKYSEIFHVRDFGLSEANDFEIFMFARNQGFDAILTIDEDFVKQLQIFGLPPKIVWLRAANCSTPFLAEILLTYFEQIQAFIHKSDFKCFQILGK